MSFAKVRAMRQRELEGGWIGPDVHELEGAWFRVRGWDNPETNLLRDTLNAAALKERDGEELSQDERDRITAELLIETVVLDWKGSAFAETEGGAELPFSKDKAREVFTDPLLKPYRLAAGLAAFHVAKKGRETAEADAKN